MPDDQDLQDTEGPPTPEDEAHEREVKESLAWLDNLEKDGWQPRGSGPGLELYDPRDPEASVWFNPLTGKLFLSPKYAQRVKSIVQAARK